MGRAIDQRLRDDDVRLTMGGEPTFVSIDDMEGAEWNSAAVGPHKRRLSETLVKRLRERIAPGGLLHYGQGKWYPGESLPRWALACYWRRDGVAIWHRPELIADVAQAHNHTLSDAKRLAWALAEELEFPTHCVMPAYEDVAHYLIQEQKLPIDVDPTDPQLRDPEARARMVQVFQRGLDQPVGLVIPMQSQWWQARASRWQSGRWPLRGGKLLWLPGDAPSGLRLPLDSLPTRHSSYDHAAPADPSAPLPPLPDPRLQRLGKSPTQSYIAGAPGPVPVAGVQQQTAPPAIDEDCDQADSGDGMPLAQELVRTALCIEPRDGRLHVFMPPVNRLEDYLDLLSAIELAAARTQLPVVIEGYLPPPDPRIDGFKVTPDPGVIEVNLQPAGTWDDLVQNTELLYEEAGSAAGHREIRSRRQA